MTADPIRIFVGCDSNNCDLESQSVLEWSLRKHTKRELDIQWMQQSRDPQSPWYVNGGAGWQTQPWTTPFSGFRWAICELCNFEGQAIYTDSDVIYTADIGELWDEPFQSGKIVIAKGNKGNARHGQRYCVSKWDCAASKSFLPPVATIMANEKMHRHLMQKFAANQDIVQPFQSGEWNCLDGEGYKLGDPKLKAIHYTGIPTQPQLRYAVPRMKREGGRHWFHGTIQPHPRKDIVALFDTLLMEATEAGHGIERYRKEPYGAYRIRDGR